MSYWAVRDGEDFWISPKAWREGHDSQLERAVEVAMEALKQTPLSVQKRPAYPNYHKAASPK
jgi:tricorn protease